MLNPYENFNFAGTENDLAVCIDMSNDFTHGVLGSPEAVEAIPWAAWFMSHFLGERAYTLDTHGNDYLDTQEGRNLPIPHGKRDTDGWRLVDEIRAVVRPRDHMFEKPTFGSSKLYEYVRFRTEHDRPFKRIWLLGRCTGICVIANGIMCKTADPEAEIHVLSKLCSCVTPGSHDTAIAAMAPLQFVID